MVAAQKSVPGSLVNTVQISTTPRQVKLFVEGWGMHEDFLEAGSTGSLPAVSLVDPRYTILDDCTDNDTITPSPSAMWTQLGKYAAQHGLHVKDVV